jgi:hypothetical protein
MQIRQLDSNGDWTFGQGKSNYLQGDDAIKLNIQTRFNEWVGDCFFNAPAGIDWINRIGSFNKVDQTLIDVKRLILQSFGVVQLQELSHSLIDRNLVINYSIKTIFSPSVQSQLIQQGGLNA